MGKPITSGVSSYVLWGSETTYKTAVTPTKHFGLDTSFSASLNNNLSGRRGFKGSTTSGRDVQKYVSGKVDYGLSVEFDVNNAEIFEHILGTVSSGTYTGSDIPKSITVANCLDNDTDRNELYSGVVINSASIKGAINEPVTMSLDMLAATMDYDSTLTTNTAITDKNPYTFTEATFHLPSGIIINNIVESFTLDVNNNYTLLYGSSREAVNYVPGAREYSLKLSTKYVDDDLLNKALGGTTVATDEPTINPTAEIILTRPDNSTLTLTGTLAPISNYDLSAQLNSAISEDITLEIANLQVVEA